VGGGGVGGGGVGGWGGGAGGGGGVVCGGGETEKLGGGSDTIPLDAFLMGACGWRRPLPLPLLRRQRGDVTNRKG